MSATKSLHYELACKAATWIRQRKNAEPWKTPYNISAVELVCMGAENPDVYATNGCDSVVIEVKVSHSDFMADKKKFARNKDNENYAMGTFRYYLCPEGVISQDELPEQWGLLYYVNGKIKKIVQAPEQKNVERIWDIMVLWSIMRREGLVGKTYNYRNTTVTNSAEEENYMIDIETEVK